MTDVTPRIPAIARLLFLPGISAFFRAQAVRFARGVAETPLAPFAIVRVTRVHAIQVPFFHLGETPPHGVMPAGRQPAWRDEGHVTRRALSLGEPDNDNDYQLHLGGSGAFIARQACRFASETLHGNRRGFRGFFRMSSVGPTRKRTTIARRQTGGANA